MVDRSKVDHTVNVEFHLKRSWSLHPLAKNQLDRGVHPKNGRQSSFLITYCELTKMFVHQKQSAEQKISTPGIGESWNS